jgi:serine/threonine protein kinase
MGDDGILSGIPTNVCYFAPELLAAGCAEITAQSDVYSFAMLCFQVLAGVRPWYNAAEEELVVLAREGHSVERPQTDLSIRWLSDEIWELLTSCWSKDPASRPSMSFVVATLRILQRARRDPSTS